MLSSVLSPFFILFSKQYPRGGTVKVHIFKVEKNKFRGMFSITQAVSDKARMMPRYAHLLCS